MTYTFTCAVSDDVGTKLKSLTETRNVSRNSLVKEGITMVLKKYESES